MPPDKPKFRWPPLTILWIAAIFIVPEILKRALGWPGPPPRGHFDAGARFLEHLMADFVLGLPIFIPFMILIWWYNRKRGEPNN